MAIGTYKPGAFGRNMLRRRRAQGITQDRMEELTGLDQAYLSRLERGVIQWPSAPIAARIAQALGCTIEDLLDGGDDDDTAGLLQLQAA